MDDPTMPKRPLVAALKAIEQIKSYRSWAAIDMLSRDQGSPAGAARVPAGAADAGIGRAAGAGVMTIEPLYHVDVWDDRARCWRAVQLNPGEVPVTLPLAEAEQMEQTIRGHMPDARTRIVKAPPGHSRHPRKGTR